MPIPELEFYELNWLAAPAAVGAIQFRLIAAPPVAANVGVEIFRKLTNPPPGQIVQWTPVGKTFLDNLPNTLPGSGFQLPINAGFDYVLRFRGEAHLLDPGFQTVSAGFELSTTQGPLTAFNGPRTTTPARAAGITGSAYVRCV